MGFLSCFAPLLSVSRSSDSTASGDALLDEKLPISEPDRVVRRSDTTARLAALRKQMKDAGVDVYVVPTADAHGSEYVGDCDKRRAWLSGFTGSAGVAVVTTNAAFLFTDSRYYVQAAQQLDSNWQLQKVGQDKVKNWNAWLLDLPKGTKIGIDPSLLDYAAAKPLTKDLADRGLSLEFPASNLVDKVWHDRPARSAATIKRHPLKFAGKSAADKIADLRTYLASTFPSSHAAFLLTSLSPIAWLLNMRGSDIEFNPVFYSYVLVKEDEIVLWAQEQAVGQEVREAIEELGGRIETYVSDIGAQLKAIGGAVVCDAKVNWAIVEAVGEDHITIVKSPVEAAQAIKNDIELEGFRQAYLRDGAAWSRWAGWLEEELRTRKVTEWEAAEKLTWYRQKNEYYAGLAYENISATGGNAALPHYAPSPEDDIPISLHSPYLNDSGPHYLDGTIDTTRTMHFGRPTSEHKRAFTRVLQGHIAVDSLVFPEGTTGATIDVLARSPLWSEGMNYGHGTGHGIGISVHEAQIGISGSLAYFNTPFLPGHLTSNEPGYYEAGAYGIRIESVIGVKEVKTRRDFGDRKWLGFERFTMIPIQSKLVDFSLLSPKEAKWLREHNRLCVEKLLPLVKDDKRAVKWLTGQ
ncbi:hypothetical protein JCM1841_004287 [Sporobolomyces salmonicolor]